MTRLIKGWASHVTLDELPAGDYGFGGRAGPAPRYDATLERTLVDEANALLHAQFTCLEAMWNVYSGTSGVGFHHDHMWPYIAIVSFGESADFMLDPCDRHNDTRHIVLDHGDLLWIPEDVNHEYAHAVKSYDNDRWSLVLRPSRYPQFSTMLATCRDHEHAQEEFMDSMRFASHEDRAS